MNPNKQLRSAIMRSLYNISLNTGQRIQKRRRTKGKRQIVRVDLSKVPRKKGGIGQRGPINPKVAARTMATNIGARMSGLQISGNVIVNGTEHVATLGTGLNDLPPAFKVLYSTVLNPADPGLCPMLAATSNQFQRFTSKVLKLTYAPASSAAVDGTVYFIVYPDPNAPDPETLQDVMAAANMKQYPAYGEPVTWTIPQASIQQAYKVQTVAVPPTQGSESPLNASGKLVIAEMNVPVSKTIGTCMFTYAYSLSLAKITHGANAVMGAYDIPASVSKEEIIFDADTLTEGWDTLLATDTDGVYRPRIPGAQHLLVLKTDGSTTPYTQEVSVSLTGDDWVDVNPIFAQTGTGNSVVGIYKLPVTNYVRLLNDATATLTGGKVFVTSLRG